MDTENKQPEKCRVRVFSRYGDVFINVELAEIAPRDEFGSWIQGKDEEGKNIAILVGSGHTVMLEGI
jgi:hypothetical protein